MGKSKELFLQEQQNSMLDADYRYQEFLAKYSMPKLSKKNSNFSLKKKTKKN